LPKYSPQAFAQRVKSTNPALGQLDDNTAVQVWLKQYPGDREYLDDPGNLFGEVERAQKLLAPPTDIDLPLEEGQTRDPRLDNPDLRVPEPLPTVEPPSNTLYEMAKGAPFALRSTGGILGAVAGGIAGSGVPGAGTAAGVATGGMAGQAGGEFLAQLIERHVIGGAPEMTPMQAGKDAARIALNAALGGYVPKALDPTTAAVKVLGRRAVEGGLIGAGAVGLDVGLEGRLPTAPELAMSAGMGAGAGLVGGALEARSLSKVAAAQAANKRAHEALQMALRNKAMVEGFQPPIGPERQLGAGAFVAGERGIAAPGMEYPRVESRLTHQMPPDATPTVEEIGQILPQPRDIAAQYSGSGEPIRWNPPDEDVVYTGSGRTLLSEFGVPNTLDEQMEKLGRPFVPPTTETGTVVGSPLYGITPGEPPPPAPAPTTETIPVTDLPPPRQPARGPLTPAEIQAADTTPPPAEMMGGGKAGPQFQKMLSLGGPAVAMAIPESEETDLDNLARAGLISTALLGAFQGIKGRGRIPRFNSGVSKRMDTFAQKGAYARNWYKEAGPMLLKAFNGDQDKVRQLIQMLSATSQNATVKANTKLAIKAYQQAAEGVPFSGYMGVVTNNLNKLMKGEQWGGPKLQNFVDALMGDENAVVVDRWIMRAMGRKEHAPRTVEEYNAIAEAVRDRAKAMGVTPAEYQAMVWAGVRGGGEDFATLMRPYIEQPSLFTSDPLAVIDKSTEMIPVAGSKAPLATVRPGAGMTLRTEAPPVGEQQQLLARPKLKLRPQQPEEIVSTVSAARAKSLERGTGDGATVSLTEGDMWGSGKFAVGVKKFGEVLDNPTDEQIADYIRRRSNLLKQPGYSFGIWRDSETGQVWLDTVRLFDDEKTARAFGKKQDQIAIGQLHPEGFKEIRLKPAPSEMVGLEHRSLTEGLTEIDPSYYEPSFLEGRRGAQAIPRSYYTKKGGFVEARFKGMPHVYEGEVPQEGLYDIVTDPLGIRAKAQARGEDWALDMERGIKEAGFKGYYYSSHENPMFRDTVVMFEKLPVKHRLSEPYLRQLKRLEAERGVQMAGPLAKAGAFAAGAATGAALGDTPEERVTLGLGLGAVGAGLVRGPKKPPKLPKGMSQKAEQLLTAQASDATGSKGSILPLASRAKQAVVSRFAPQDFLAEQAEKNIGRKLRPEEHPGEMNRIIAGGTGGRTRAAKYELEDLIGESKKAGLEPELRLYLNMKGILHGAKTLEGRGAAGAAKAASGKAFPLKYTPEEAERELAEQMKRLGPEKAKQLEAMGSKLFDFNRQTLEMIKPIIPKSTYDELVERGKEYVPLYRRTGLRIEDGVVVGGPDGIGTQHVERLKGAGLSLNQIKSLQKLEGSEMITQDPLQASLYLRRLAEQELGRNQAAQTLYNLRKIDPNGVGKAIVPLKGDIRPPRGHEELSFRFNGPDGKTYVQRFAVPSEVAQAQKMLDGIELMAGWTAVGGVLGAGKTVLQASATGLNIPFAIWNVQRDFRTARRFLKGQKQFNPSDAIQYAREWGEALRHRLRKDDNFREALRARALHGTLQETLVPQSLKLGKEPEGAVRFVLRNISDWNRALEETTKLSAYNRVKRAHPDWSPDQIAQEVRKFGGSPDFADSGTLNARGLGLAFMFLNPGIQGIAQNMRGIGRAPGKAALMLGTAIGASIALYRWNSQFIAEDGRPEIEHVPKHDRDASFVILLDSKDPQTGRRHYLTVFPKSHADRLFYNTVQDAIQMAAGDTGITPGQLAADAASQFLPGSFQLNADEPVQSLLTGMAATSNPIIRVPLELAGNRRAYENIPIESQRELRLPPQSRYDARTSPLAVKVGKVTGKATEGFPDFLTLGPKKVEQVMRTFGAPGQMLTSSIDTALNRGSEKMQPEGLEKVKKLPVVGPLVARGVRGGGDQRLRDRADKVYDRFDLAEKTANELASVEKREPARLEQFLRDPENIKRLTEADVLREGLGVLGELRTQRELILNGTVKPGNPSAELRRLREIEVQLMAQLEQALKLR